MAIGSGVPTHELGPVAVELALVGLPLVGPDQARQAVGGPRLVPGEVLVMADRHGIVVRAAGGDRRAQIVGEALEVLLVVRGDVAGRGLALHEHARAYLLHDPGRVLVDGAPLPRL